MDSEQEGELGSSSSRPEDQPASSVGDFDRLLEDEDHQPSDPVDAEDPAVFQAMVDWDAGQYDSEAPGFCDGAADEPSAEEFAAELIDSGPDTAAALLESMEPGPEMAVMLAMLRPAVLQPAAMVSVIAATEKLLSWVQARQHRWLAAFACPGVVAPRSALQQYACQPGQPLHPRKRRRSEPEAGSDFATPNVSANQDESVS
ncbi:MAG: hypothetical protein ABWZ98_10750, partial [Nakamurella sp.]